MSKMHLLYNSVTAGGDIRATIQKLTDSGLGDFWKDQTLPTGSPTAAAFVTTATAFADRSYPVTEQTLGDAAVAYYGNADTTDMVYSGRLVIGYHDNAGGANKEVLFSEVRYVRNGVDVSFALPNDRILLPVGNPFLWKMSRRADGSVVATNKIYLSDRDVGSVAFETKNLVADGVFVSSISNITVTPAGAVTVVDFGPRDSHAVIELGGGQVSGTTYDVTCVALMTDGQSIELNGKLVCQTTPATS